MNHPYPRRWPLLILGTACVCVAIMALELAGRWYAHPVAGMLVDSGGMVANVGLPGWEAKRIGLRFPDTVLSVDGKPLLARVARAGKGPRAAIWDAAVEDAWRSGRNTIEARVQTESGVRDVHLGIHPLEPAAWWIYAGSLLFAGLLYIGAGFIAVWASPESPLARAFGRVGLFTGLMCLLMFDFLTTRRLGSVFLWAFGMTPLSWVMLTLRLPDDVPILRRFRWLEFAADAVGAAISTCFLLLYWTGHQTKLLQSIWTVALGGSFLVFGAVFALRFSRAEGLRRARMRALLVSMVPPLVAVGACTIPAFRGNATMASYPCLSLFPLATAYAFIRYDLWGSRALLSRLLTRIAVGAIACTLAVGVAAAFAMSLGVSFGSAFLAAGFGGVAATASVLAALSFSDRHLFASRLEYKPTVAQLSEELVSIRSPDEVARAVERTIRRWLPCELVEVALSHDGSGAFDLDGSVVSGTHPTYKADQPDVVDQLELPIEFGGARIGTLFVGEKCGNALFTEDDVDLLRTIVNQGALAFAHARAYQELEARRREQAAAWRGERAALVETVAAEIAHEIRYPINFFRSVFDRKDQTFDAEDFDIGREEVDRLERLVAGLRRLAIHRVERRSVRLLELCERTETLLRDELGPRWIQVTVPERAELRCDPDQVLQIIVNLVANGLQACGVEGAVGVNWVFGPKAAQVEVWDTGPGFDCDPAMLFAPWYTTKPKGTGLGLAIAHRFVRAHGWSIEATRRENRTVFVVTIRTEDVTDSGEGIVGGRSTKVA